ncbi:hypothetical protein NL676_012121 [Syzygium grande]|nr:hypothetical protein NL676_012121 [Syzygium grande]
MLGAKDGLLLTISLMMGIDPVRKDIKTMAIFKVAGLIPGPTTIGELVSVHSQYNIEEVAEMKREGRNETLEVNEMDVMMEKLPSPRGGEAVSVALVKFSELGAVLGKTLVVKSTSRVLLGGWLAMVITFGLTKPIGSTGP